MLEMLKAAAFGVVEGITEWLPISSTGHMILLEEIMPFSKEAVSSQFMEMFLVVIQLGAIMAVVLMYWNQLFPFSFKKDENFIKKDIFSMWFKIVAACIPAVIIELAIGDQIEKLFYRYEVVAIMLILFGILFIIVERWNKNRRPVVRSIGEITYKTALIIGVFQVIAAVFPGTSRSGATILGALLIGVSRTVAAEFTFFLAVPVMFGASFLKLLKFGLAFTGQELAILLVGMAVAFVVSVAVIRLLMGYIKKHDFQPFGYYRIILGILVLLLYPLL